MHSLIVAASTNREAIPGLSNSPLRSLPRALTNWNQIVVVLEELHRAQVVPVDQHIRITVAVHVRRDDVETPSVPRSLMPGKDGRFGKLKQIVCAAAAPLHATAAPTRQAIVISSHRLETGRIPTRP